MHECAMKSLSLFVSNSDTGSSQIAEQTFYFATFSSVESKLQDDIIQIENLFAFGGFNFRPSSLYSLCILSIILIFGIGINISLQNSLYHVVIIISYNKHSIFLHPLSLHLLCIYMCACLENTNPCIELCI